jgi:hypothetical protein
MFWQAIREPMNTVQELGLCQPASVINDPLSMVEIGQER